MLKPGKIFLYLGVLFCLSIVGGVAYYLSNYMLKADYHRNDFLNSFGIALVFCIPSYIIYLIVNNVSQSKKKLLNLIIISVLSFALTFLALYAFTPYRPNFSNPVVKKSMLVFLFTALSLPFLEKIIFKNN